MHHYPKIDKFIRISRVDNPNQYRESIAKFKNDLLHYHEAAVDPILMKNTIGDSEYFYAHVILSYCPQTIDRILEEHKMGFGILMCSDSRGEIRNQSQQKKI